MAAVKIEGRRRQRGSVAVITGLAIAVLVGFLGLAVDLGRLFVIKAELQTGMDACALAAASQLRPGLNDPGALDRAIAFGRTPANRVNFQGQGLVPNSIQFSFSDTLAGPYTSYAYGAGGAAALANSARYARCTYPLEDVPVLFMRVLNAVTETTVAATAVATLAPSQTNCGFPVAVCRDPAATASQNPPWGLAPGSWVSGLGSTGPAPKGSQTVPDGCSAGTGSGSFCWIDFSPPGGGADELGNLIQGQGQCDLTINNEIGTTGVKASLVDSWATRFGIYPKAGSSVGDVNTAPPDFTGYSYTATNWPAQSNAYADYRQRRATHAPFNFDSGVSLKQSDAPITSMQHQQFGRDRRIVLAPIMNCSEFQNTQKMNMDAWACILLLAPISNPGGGSFSAKFEYLGLANAPGTPCASSGLAGGTAGPLVPVLVQ